MKLIRFFIISALVCAILITLLSLLIPSRVQLSRNRTIHTNADNVWKVVDDMKTWNKWNPMFEGVDTSLVKWNYRSNGTVAGMQIDQSLIRWSKMTMDDRRVEILRENKKPVITGWRTQPFPSGDSVSIQWYMELRLQWYPWEKLASLLFEKAYGSQMEAGLYQLKKIAEYDRSSKN